MARREVHRAKALKSYPQSEVVPEEVEIEAAVADGDGGEVGDADYCHWDHRTFAVLREDAGVIHGGDAAASVEVAAGDVAEVAVAASEARTSFVAAGQKDGGMLPAPWAEAERGQMAHMVVRILL